MIEKRKLQKIKIAGEKMKRGQLQKIQIKNKKKRS